MLYCVLRVILAVAVCVGSNSNIVLDPPVFPVVSRSKFEAWIPDSGVSYWEVSI